MLDEYSADVLAECLYNRGDTYRVLQRLDIQKGVLIETEEKSTVGLVVDVETNGLDPNRHQIIELAVRRFRYDADGRILRLDHPYSWFEDPGEPLDPAITALTGITDEILASTSIDAARASALFRSADICIAHKASFDRRFVERRLPEIAGKAWACSLEEVNWRRRGFDGSGRALGWLLMQCGWFHDAHRAGDDVDAVLAILQHRSKDGTTALAELLSNAEKPSWLINAIGAHFDVKDSLKARGYRWNGDDSVWYRQVTDAMREKELTWLAEYVYAPEFCPRADGPALREMTRFNRYA